MKEHQISITNLQRLTIETEEAKAAYDELLKKYNYNLSKNSEIETNLSKEIQKSELLSKNIEKLEIVKTSAERSLAELESEVDNLKNNKKDYLQTIESLEKKIEENEEIIKSYKNKISE